jgi:putative transposon-encoded protein
MKILSWNLYNLFNVSDLVNQEVFNNAEDAEVYISKRVDYFSKEIQKMDVEVAFFFEVASEEVLRRIIDIAWGTSDYYVFGTTKDKRGIYNAVVSKNKLDTNEVFIKDLELPLFQIDETGLRNKYLVQKRGYAKAEIGNTIIYGVHLKSKLPSSIKTTNGEDFEIKNSLDEARTQILGEIIGLAESYAIRKFISTDIENKKDVVILGDYNDDTHSRRLKIIRGMYDGEDEMKDIFDINSDVDYSLIHKNSKMRFDHVLVSKNIFEKVSEKQMISKEINIPKEYIGIDKEVIGSDHAPIVFDLNI